jgi:hypothetical protein
LDVYTGAAVRTKPNNMQHPEAILYAWYYGPKIPMPVETEPEFDYDEDED